MSSRVRVLRAVRLLPQAVKIGVPAEERPDAASAAPSPSEEGAAPRPSPRREGARKAPRKAPPGPSALEKALLQKVDALQADLDEAQAHSAELFEAKEKLEAEIEGIRSDYENRRKTLEAESKAAADKEAKEARERGRAEGLKAGHDEGLAAARAEVKKEYQDKFSSLVANLEGISQRLEEDFAGLVGLNQPRMIRLWTEMLRRMLRRQVELRPDTVNVVLADLLSHLSDKNQIVVYASPEDIGHLQAEADGEFQEVLRGVRHFEMNADPHVEKGSCIVETKLGVYDARWRTQMGQVESVIDSIFQQIVKEERKAGQDAPEETGEEK